MTFIYPTRDFAETMAAAIADADHVSIAVFNAFSDGSVAICLLDEFGQPNRLIAIYEPRS